MREQSYTLRQYTCGLFYSAPVSMNIMIFIFQRSVNRTFCHRLTLIEHFAMKELHGVCHHVNHVMS